MTPLDLINWAWRQEVGNSRQKMLLIYLATRQGDKGSSYAKNKTIMEHMEIKKDSTFYDARNGLIESGLISYDDGVYVVNFDAQNIENHSYAPTPKNGVVTPKNGVVDGDNITPKNGVTKHRKTEYPTPKNGVVDGDNITPKNGVTKHRKTEYPTPKNGVTKHRKTEYPTPKNGVTKHRKTEYPTPKNGVTKHRKTEYPTPKNGVPYPEKRCSHIEEQTINRQLTDNEQTIPPLPPQNFHDQKLPESETDKKPTIDQKIIDQLWQAYPQNGRNRGSKKQFVQQLKSKIRKGIDHERIFEGIKRYAGYIQQTNQLNKDAFRWIRDEGWEDDYTLAEQKTTNPTCQPRQNISDVLDEALYGAGSHEENQPITYFVDEGDNVVRDVPRHNRAFSATMF